MATPGQASSRPGRKPVLPDLAATSHVAAAARAAGIDTARVYELRRRDPGFYRDWQEALCEGYDHLEMALLQRLREGEIRRAGTAKRGVRVYDNATALRLLGAHREAVMRQRAAIANRNSEAVLAAINAKIDRMRERRIRALADERAARQVPDGKQ